MPENTHDSFVKRLTEIAADLGSRSALEKEAGLPAGSLYNYVTGGSEPTRPVLLALARAANVSLAWLAEGFGTKERRAVPPGYEEVPFYDLRSSAWRVQPMVWGQIAHGLVVKAEWLSAGVKEPFAVEAPNNIRGRINAGDLLLIRGDVPAVLDRKVIYLVSWKAEARLRQLRPRRDGIRPEAAVGRHFEHSLLVLRPDSPTKVERIIEPGTAAFFDFEIHGMVTWRAGAP